MGKRRKKFDITVAYAEIKHDTELINLIRKLSQPIFMYWFNLQMMRRDELKDKAKNCIIPGILRDILNYIKGYHSRKTVAHQLATSWSVPNLKLPEVMERIDEAKLRYKNGKARGVPRESKNHRNSRPNDKEVN